MKVLVDATTTQDQFATRGIGVATRETISELISQSSRKNRNDEYILLLFKSPTTLSPIIKEYSGFIKTIDLGPLKLSGKFDGIWWRSKFLPAIRSVVSEHSPDLYYAPYFFRGLPVGVVPTVAMIYDFAFPVMKKYSSAPWYLDWIRKLQYHAALRKLLQVDRVVAISDRTRKDIPKYLPKFDKEKAQTVYLGLRNDLRQKQVNQNVLEEYLPLDVIKRGYILYYGGLEVNKNVPGLIKGYRALLNLWPGVMKDKKPPYLVLAGGDFTRLDTRNPVLKKVRDLINELGLEEHVAFTGYYDDEHLVDLLNGASLFVHLSLYEGFGFSPLEAMKCGVPVVASNRSCYPEVLGDGAVLVDPEDPKAVARGCVSLLENGEMAKDQGKKGINQAAKYTWKSTAEELYKVFEGVASKK